MNNPNGEYGDEQQNLEGNEEGEEFNNNDGNFDEMDTALVQSNQIDEETELKKKIALYYHQMVSILNFEFQKSVTKLNAYFLNLVLKLSCIMVCTFVTRKLFKVIP